MRLIDPGCKDLDGIKEEPEPVLADANRVCISERWNSYDKN